MKWAKKTIYRRIADIIFIFHILVLLTILFGWWVFPQSLLWVSQATVLLTIVFGLLNRGVCILTQYEWRFRRKYSQEEFKDTVFLPFYIRKYFKKNPSERFFNRLTLAFLFLALCINIYLLFVY